ncbi:MAG: phosphoribosyltransferase family protein [Amaricoccus sp.]
MTRFRDRAAAGDALAEALAARGLRNPVVLALPRGGVPVAAPVAKRLGAPLDLLIVRKIGVPRQPELAAGAVADGGEIVVNDAIAARFGLDRRALEALAEAERAEIARRRAVYLRGRPPVPVAGRTAILVDDGIATGATMRAALAVLRQRRPARLVLAVPVADEDVLRELDADETVCLQRSLLHGAVGASYADFAQLEDAEVTRLLDAAG